MTVRRKNRFKKISFRGTITNNFILENKSQETFQNHLWICMWKVFTIYTEYRYIKVRTMLRSRNFRETLHIKYTGSQQYQTKLNTLIHTPVIPFDREWVMTVCKDLLHTRKCLVWLSECQILFQFTFVR